MSQRVRSHEAEVESRRIAPQEEHLLGQWAAVAGAGATVLVAAMATSRWQTTRFGVVGLFGHRGPAIQAAIEVQLDAHAALMLQAGNSDEVRQVLVAIWRLELAALLRQHPDAEDQLRTLVVRVWEALPTAQQTWVQTDIACNHGSSPLIGERYAVGPTYRPPGLVGRRVRPFDHTATEGTWREHVLQQPSAPGRPA
jgi:hypothetical protein